MFSKIFGSKEREPSDRKQLIQYAPALMLANLKAAPAKMTDRQNKFLMLCALQFEIYLFGVYLEQIAGGKASELIIKDTFSEVIKSAVRLFQKYEHTEGNQKRFNDLVPAFRILPMELGMASCLVKYPPEANWMDSATGKFTSHLAKVINMIPTQDLLLKVADAVRRHMDAHVRNNTYSKVVARIDWNNI